MTATATPRAERIRSNSADRRTRAKEDTKRTILNAATALFEARGYDGFSLRQVAESIGYTATTIYLYFKDKDELLLAVCAEGFAGFGAALEAASNSTADPALRIREIGRAYINFGLTHPVHYRVMFMQTPDFVLSAVNQPREDVSSYQIFLDAVTAAMRAGVIPVADPLETTNLLWAGVHGLVSLSLSSKGVAPKWDEESVKRMFEVQHDLLERGWDRRIGAGVMD